MIWTERLTRGRRNVQATPDYRFAWFMRQWTGARIVRGGSRRNDAAPAKRWSPLGLEVKAKRFGFLRVMVVAALVCGGVGCSREYKVGSRITPQDLTNALPEFLFALPTGATNLYLEHTTLDPRLVRTLYKVSLPVSGLTNFLHGFGFMDEFTRMPTQTLALIKDPPTLPGLSPGGMGVWLANAPREAHHASEWNPHKAKAPLRMYLKARPAISPAEEVIMTAFVDDSGSEQAIVYLDYMRARLPKH